MAFELPWIHVGQNKIPTHQDQVYMADWAGWIYLQSSAELSALQWSFNVKNLLQDALDRNLNFINSLNSFSPTETCWERSLLIRMYPGKGVLKLLLIVRCLGNSKEQAVRNAEESWSELQASYPRDYTLAPLSQSEYAEIVEQNSAQSCSRARFISILYPCARRLTLSPDQEVVDMFTSVGCWSVSEASQELVWRAIYNARHPVTLEIFLQPTILQPKEFAALTANRDLAEDLISQDDHLTFPIQNWLKALAERKNNLRQAYLLQIRLFSAQPIPGYMERIIGVAHTSQNRPFNNYDVLKPSDPEQLLYWQDSLNKFEFIDSGALFSIPPRLPYLVTLAEAASIFRPPYSINGGTNTLVLDKLTV